MADKKKVTTAPRGKTAKGTVKSVKPRVRKKEQTGKKKSLKEKIKKGLNPAGKTTRRKAEGGGTKMKPKGKTSDQKKKKSSSVAVDKTKVKKVLQKPPSTPAKSSQAPARQTILRKQLIQKREDIVKEAKDEIAKYIKGETNQLVETALDDGDWSVIDLSADINLRRLETHRESLLRIDAALMKLREGTYGICEDCGEEISAERLKAMPFAIYCRDCQEKREEIEKVTREEVI